MKKLSLGLPILLVLVPIVVGVYLLRNPGLVAPAETTSPPARMDDGDEAAIADDVWQSVLSRPVDDREGFAAAANNRVVSVNLGGDASSRRSASPSASGSRIDIMHDELPIAVDNGQAFALAHDLQVVVSVSPYPPNALNADVDFYLTTAAGEPVADAVFELEYDMLYMAHGAAEARFDSAGDGHYATSLNFSMFGSWALNTAITLPGNTERLTLPVVLYVWPT